MKVTNVSAGRIYLADLRLAKEAQTVGRRGEDRYLGPGEFAYFPDTSEVLRSAHKGDLRKLAESGQVTLNDTVELAASPGPGNVFMAHHDFGYMPAVTVTCHAGGRWVDASGMFDLSHNEDFTETTITNVTEDSMTFHVRFI